jgi:hypothetical protein
MRTLILVSARLVAAFVGIALGIFCGYGFLASYEYGFPNVFHFLYGAMGLAVATATVLIIFVALKPDKRTPGRKGVMIDDEIVSVAIAGSLQEAQLWRQELEEEGIPCRIVGEYLGSFGIVPPGHPVPEVWVHRKDIERAKEILDALFVPVSK